MAVRNDNDTWDLATSVGATATMVAAARAAASRRAGAVVHDPFAKPLVLAAGIDFFRRLANGELEFGDVETGWMPDVFAVRAKFFDDFFHAAVQSSVRQVVMLASGLDSRSYRLRWPSGTIIYEVDQPEVIDFKSATLATIGALPTAELRTVGIDLRHNWPAALKSSGFNLSIPTAWSAEGLLIGYLPGDAQDRLIDDITALSADGSKVAVDHLPSHAQSLGPKMADITKQWKEHGFDSDIGNLTYAQAHNDIDSYLQRSGWAIERKTLRDLFADAGIGSPTTEALTLTGEIEYVDAVRGATLIDS
jgi:methyltransferase (TIGR00027 family)